ncbi:MAG: hypothetical protein ACLQBB_15655 [Solirubrobacteraceae bacterium]
MSDKSEEAVLYGAVYNDVDSAITDLEAFEQLHKAKVIGKYDAAVIDQQEGKPHIVKRADHPRIQVIAEWFGAGKLPRRELHEAAQALDAAEAALIVIGEPTLQKGFEQAVTRAASTIKRDLNTTTDQLAKELITASKQAASTSATGQA